MNVNCLRCGGSSPGTGRGVNGSWHAHPATGERWLCSPCFFLVRRQADKRQCMDCGADAPGTCKSAVWHRSPGGNSWLCTRCHGRAYEQTKKLRRSALKRECEAAVTDWAAAEHSAQPRTRRQRAAMQQQERSGGGAAGATCTAASQPTTPSVMEAMEAAAGVLSGLARSQWAAPQDRQGQELQLASLGRGEQGEGWAEGQRAGQAGQHGGAQQQGAQLPPGGQARQLPPGDLFELLLSVADMTAGQGLTRPLVASFYSLLDGLPPEQKAVRVGGAGECPGWAAGGASANVFGTERAQAIFPKSRGQHSLPEHPTAPSGQHACNGPHPGVQEWRLLRLLCEGSFPAAAQMMATALLLAGVPA